MRYVIQRHQASSLHFDLRLELQGVLVSWAVPKGPSMVPAQRRLAIRVEDHPVDYIDFEGEIPEGEYGAGVVRIWDKGTYIPIDGEQKPVTEEKAAEDLRNGELKFILNGSRLNGGFVLVRMKNGKNWLLIKQKDAMPVKKIKQADPLRDSELNDGNEKTVVVKGHKVKLTNISKIYWPDERITKGQMLDYYGKMAPVILPYLKDRPLSLNRMPDGIKRKGFYHKDAGEHVPSFVMTEQVESASTHKTIDYIVCNNAASLLYVANLGSIEMNPWNSTRRKPDHPTYIVIDIDPSDHNTFSQVVDTALAATQVLERAGAGHCVKTSGATGLHIYIPLGAKYEYGQAKDFAHVIAMLTNELVPEFTTLKRILKKRGNNIYIDYLQNSKGQTLASAYSVRPVKGAQVSAPIAKKELDHRLSPDQFNIFNMQKRVEKIGDIFSMVLGKGNNIRKCLRNLGY